MPEAKVLSVTVAKTPSFKWVGLRKIAWQDPDGQKREWEAAFRTTRKSECDGVAILALVSYPESGQPDEIVIVSQFRPPVDSAVLEAPAGLVDPSEKAAAAAVRELREETGLLGEITYISPIVVSDPGMTDANMRYVCLKVNGDAPENRNPKPQPEDGEHIEVSRLPAMGVLEALHKRVGSSGEEIKVDARLYAFCLGYNLCERSFLVEKKQAELEMKLQMAKEVTAAFAIGAGIATALTLAVVALLGRRGRT